MKDVKNWLSNRIEVHKAKRNEASRNRFNAVQTLLHDNIAEELEMLKKKIEEAEK